jgi:pre-mRNA-splicing factor ATP-dependent RNA helicase DHX38/PRP16
VLLLVHDTKPPFLAGQAVTGKASGVVLPLRDPTSDMAVIARCAAARVPACVCARLLAAGRWPLRRRAAWCRHGSVVVAHCQ